MCFPGGVWGGAFLRKAAAPASPLVIPRSFFAILWAGDFSAGRRRILTHPSGMSEIPCAQPALAGSGGSGQRFAAQVRFRGFSASRSTAGPDVARALPAPAHGRERTASRAFPPSTGPLAARARRAFPAAHSGRAQSILPARTSRPGIRASKSGQQFGQRKRRNPPSQAFRFQVPLRGAYAPQNVPRRAADAARAAGSRFRTRPRRAAKNLRLQNRHAPQETRARFCSFSISLNVQVE